VLLNIQFSRGNVRRGGRSNRLPSFSAVHSRTRK